MPGGSADCLVVGSGIAGVCAALFIQEKGARVVIVDPSQPGTGASFGNAGIVVNTKLMPVFAGLTPGRLLAMLRDPSSPLNVRWSRFLGLSPWFLRMLANANEASVLHITRALANLCQNGERTYAGLWQEAGMHDLVRARGSLALNLHETERDHDWDGPLALLRSMGVPMERFGRNEIAAMAPAVGPRYACGVFSAYFRHSTDPQAFVARLFALFLARGGVHRQGKVNGIMTADGRAVGLNTSEGALGGGSVVLAAGAGTAQLAAASGEAVPHQAVGGYHVMIAQPGIALQTPLLPLDFRFAITPMQAGLRLAGTYEFGGDRRPLSDAVIRDMLAHVGQVLPGIDARPASTWRGFRSYLPDGLPVISASRKTERLFYLFGLSSAGMINGAASGKALASIWSGQPAEFDVSPYAIGRFGRTGRRGHGTRPRSFSRFPSSRPPEAA